jgi:opacity protein-like surface antigen
MIEQLKRPIASTVVTGCLTLLSYPAAGSDGQLEPMIYEGGREFSLSGSPDFLGPTGDTLNVSAGYGMFVRDRMLIRASFIYTTVEDIAPGENDYRAREADIAGEYHFDLGNAFVPYVGAELGWRRSKWASDVESGVIYGGRAGLKYFISDNIAIDFAFSYKASGNDVFISDYEMENAYPSFSFGLRAML